MVDNGRRAEFESKFPKGACLALENLERKDTALHGGNTDDPC